MSRQSGRAGALSASAAGAGGKVILLGEHAVVHGQPALSTGIGWGVTVAISPAERRTVAPTPADPRVAQVIDEAARLVGIGGRVGFAVSIGGDLPVAVGLGSSAALCVALVRALAASAGRDLPAAEVAAAAQALEGIFHGTPSGVDGATATHGGVLWFEAGPPPRHEPVRPARPFDLLVVLSGTRHETARTVGSLRERAAAAPGVYGPVFSAIGGLVRTGRDAVERGDLPLLGQLMTMNHGLLRACGVSTPALDTVVERALEGGALGAKLTGGGGGGAAIALPGGEAAGLARKLRADGFEVLRTCVGES